MSLSTDDHKTTELCNTFAKLDIGTTAGHICCDGYSTLLTCVSDDLCFHLMELGIQNLMLDAALLEQIAYFFR